MGDTQIAYQNKDIASKVLAEQLKGKSFRVYGLDLPEIKQALPTNIPTVKVNELRLDNLFELADGTAAIVDYESVYSERDKVKYLNYLTGIANRYQKEEKECPKLRMIVIYTGDIKREQVTDVCNLGALKMTTECAFLSELDAVEIYGRLKRKVERKERLEDQELMEFIIYPLSYRKEKEKQENIQKAVDLAVQIQDRSQQLFALSGILAFTDKVIGRKTAEQIRRVIEMTQVAQIFEEEKQQALTQVAQIFEEEKKQALTQAAQIFEEEKKQALTQAAQTFEEEKKQAEEKAAESASKRIVVQMIKKNYSAEEIAALVLNYSLDDVEALRKEVMEKDD